MNLRVSLYLFAFHMFFETLSRSFLHYVGDVLLYFVQDILAGKFGDILLTKRDAMGWLEEKKDIQF